MLTDVSGCNGGNTGLAAISALDVVDPVTDVYNILEGSALVPFTEVCRIVYCGGSLNAQATYSPRKHYYLA